MTDCNGTQRQWLDDYDDCDDGDCDDDLSDASTENMEFISAEAFSEDLDADEDKQKRASLRRKLAQYWGKLPSVQTTDTYGYGRIPAFWYTLNFPYNYLWEVHRFHHAIQDFEGASYRIPFV